MQAARAGDRVRVHWSARVCRTISSRRSASSCSRQEGQAFVVRVTDVSPESVTLDANHPLAGEDLTFQLQLVNID